MSPPDTENISNIIKDCAQQYILPRFQMLKDEEVSTKTGPADLVTQADLDVEEHLARVLPDLLPGSIVLGEEGVSQNHQSLDILKNNDQKIWIIDPVDGTYNFVHGRPEFGVMLALIADGETVQSWIYDVPADVMYTAEKGSGTYKDDQKLCIEEKEKPEEIIMHINPRYFPKTVRPQIEDALTNFRGVESLGSAAHEYTRIITGKSDASIYGRTKPWDHLAGVLMVTEAGGYAARMTGESYIPAQHVGNLLVTGGQKSWGNVKDLITSYADLNRYIDRR